MKKYLKGLIFRLLFFIIVLFVLLFILDKTIYMFSENIQWLEENKKIVKMNFSKLQSNSWSSKNVIFKYADDTKLAPKGNNKRIFVVGDSFIWGYGYSNLNHTWWKQLDRILKEKGYNDVEVVAAGIPGYNTKMEVENILKNKEIMEEVDPDLIIIGFVENDIQIYNKDRQDLLKIRDNNDLFSESNNIFIKAFKKIYPSLYIKVSQAIATKGSDITWLNKKGYVNYQSWLKELTKNPWKKMYEKEALEPLKNYIKEESDIPIFTIPTLTFPSHSDIIDYMKKEWEKYEIPYYDATDDYIKAFPNSTYDIREWGINPGDTHPAVKTTNFYGNWVFNLLEKEYPNIIGKHYNTSKLPLEINDWTPYSLKPALIKDNEYEIIYPKENEKNSFLYLPIRKHYVKLNLKFATNIKSIKINGDNINSIELYTNSINHKLGWDDQVMKSLGKKKSNFTWKLNNNDLITSININAKVKNGKSTKLKIKISY
ncbi:MAG: SGNH/GDSL hydrolase family protein [Bacilli bacterium]|nr:SGNH/GDSL hydrolase family protein [Bacilli bacterium]